MIAYLSDLGIHASLLWQWVLPENTQVPGVAGQAVPRMIPIDLADPYTEHRVAAALEAVYLRRSDAIISRQDGASQGSGVEPLDWTLPRLLTKKFRSQPRLLSGMRALWQGALPTSSKTRQRVCPACKVPAISCGTVNGGRLLKGRYPLSFKPGGRSGPTQPFGPGGLPRQKTSPLSSRQQHFS